MLKAVYLDDKEHKYLIDFILSYKDSNNKNDINAAIKFLMVKGYQSLHEEQNNIEKSAAERSATERSMVEKSLVERSVVEKTMTEKTLTEAIEQLYTKINNDINNKFSMQLLENNSQLMSAIINMANKSNNTPQIIPQPYIMSAPNIPMPQQNNAVINTNANNNINTSGGEDLNNIQNKKMSNTRHKNFPLDNINTENNVIAKAKTNTLSTNSLLSNLLSNANR